MAGMIKKRICSINPDRLFITREYKFDINNYVKNKDTFIINMIKDITKLYKDKLDLQHAEFHTIDIYEPKPYPKKGEEPIFHPKLVNDESNLSILISNIRNNTNYLFSRLEEENEEMDKIESDYILPSCTCILYNKEIGRATDLGFELRKYKIKDGRQIPTFSDKRYLFILHFKVKHEDIQKEEEIFTNIKDFEF